MAYMPTPRWCENCRKEVLPVRIVDELGAKYPCPTCEEHTVRGAVHWPSGPLTPEKALELDRVHGLTDEPEDGIAIVCKACGVKWTVAMAWRGREGSYICSRCRKPEAQPGATLCVEREGDGG